MKGKERHTVALGAYKKHVKEIEDWLEEMKVRQAATPLATDSVGSLQLQLQENKVNLSICFVCKKRFKIFSWQVVCHYLSYNNHCGFK